MTFQFNHINFGVRAVPKNAPCFSPVASCLFDVSEKAKTFKNIGVSAGHSPRRVCGQNTQTGKHLILGESSLLVWTFNLLNRQPASESQILRRGFPPVCQIDQQREAIGGIVPDVEPHNFNVSLSISAEHFSLLAESVKQSPKPTHSDQNRNPSGIHHVLSGAIHRFGSVRHSLLGYKVPLLGLGAFFFAALAGFGLSRVRDNNYRDRRFSSRFFLYGGSIFAFLFWLLSAPLPGYQY